MAAWCVKVASSAQIIYKGCTYNGYQPLLICECICSQGREQTLNAIVTDWPLCSSVVSGGKQCQHSNKLPEFFISHQSVKDLINNEKTLALWGGKSMLLASANYTSLKKMVSRFLEIICFASGTKEQALEACKDCVPDSPTPTLFHHVCEAAECLPSVYSTGDRKRRETQCSLNLGSCKDNVRGNTALRGMQRGLG